MATETNNNTAVTVPSVTLKETLTSTGIELNPLKVKAARKRLYTTYGAQSINLSDETVLAADRINAALSAADSHIKTACHIAGAMRIAGTWKYEKDDNGKPFKSENAFLKGILPGYATSTISLYADVGATIYIPAADGELDDLPGVADLGPSSAKFLLSAIKDAEKRKRLPAALKDAKEANNGKLTQRAITSAVKSLSESSPKTGDSASSAGSVADELSGGATSAVIQHLITFTYNGDNADGDLTAIVLERDVKDFISLLHKASDDKDTALALCNTLYKLASKAR